MREAEPSRADQVDALSLLYLISLTMSKQLLAIDDEELYAGRKSLSASAGDLLRLVDVLKAALYHLCWTRPVMLQPFQNCRQDAAQSVPPASLFSSSLKPVPVTRAIPKEEFVVFKDRQSRVSVLTCFFRLFNQLGIRNERRFHLEESRSTLSATYIEPSRWVWSGTEGLSAESSLSRGGPASGISLSRSQEGDITANSWDLGEQSPFKFVDARTQVVLQNIPQVISFDRRAEILQKLIAADKEECGFQPLFMSQTVIEIRRRTILEDAYIKLGGASPIQLKSPIKIVFIAEDGHEVGKLVNISLFETMSEN